MAASLMRASVLNAHAGIGEFDPKKLDVKQTALHFIAFLKEVAKGFENPPIPVGFLEFIERAFASTNPVVFLNSETIDIAKAVVAATPEIATTEAGGAIDSLKKFLDSPLGKLAKQLLFSFLA